MPVPTLPIINNGPEVEQKDTNRCPSYLEILFSNLRSLANFEPTGYPDTMDIAKISPDLPLTLKIFCVRGLINMPRMSTIFNEVIKLAPIINGRRDGIRIFIQMEIPSFAAFIAVLGASIIPKIIKHTINLGAKKIIIFFNFIFSPCF